MRIGGITVRSCPAARHRRARPALGAAAAGLLLAAGLPAPAVADCMRDRDGQVVCDRGQCVRDRYGWVYCSAFEDGSALTTRTGEVVCARGQCVITLEGEIICSARPGGAAMKDIYGRVTCEGGCERASMALCGERSAGPQ